MKSRTKAPGRRLLGPLSPPTSDLGFLPLVAPPVSRLLDGEEPVVLAGKSRGRKRSVRLGPQPRLCFRGRGALESLNFGPRVRRRALRTAFGGGGIVHGVPEGSRKLERRGGFGF